MMLLSLILHAATPAPVPAIACGPLRDERRPSASLTMAAAPEPDGADGPFKLAPPSQGRPSAEPCKTDGLRKPDAAPQPKIETAPYTA